MSKRIANFAAPGTLVKQPREKDAKYLRAIRKLPCLVCRQTPSEAAHVRIGSNAGMGLKPHDRRTIPLCHKHHMEQHSLGEQRFWILMDYTAEEIMAALVSAYPDAGAMHEVCLRMGPSIF